MLLWLTFCEAESGKTRSSSAPALPPLQLRPFPHSLLKLLPSQVTIVASSCDIAPSDINATIIVARKVGDNFMPSPQLLRARSRFAVTSVREEGEVASLETPDRLDAPRSCSEPRVL